MKSWVTHARPFAAKRLACLRAGEESLEAAERARNDAAAQEFMDMAEALLATADVVNILWEDYKAQYGLNHWRH